MAQARFECDDCMTVSGCDRHGVFKCGSCSMATWYRDGGDDECPDDCSACWLAWFTPRRQIAQGLAMLLEMP